MQPTQLFRRFPLTALVLASLALASARAQGSKEDYERSAGLADRFRHKVYRQLPNIRWLDDDRLWYSLRTGPDARELVVVNAIGPEENRRRVLCTHAELTEAIENYRGEPLDEDVEVMRMSWDGGPVADLLLASGLGAWRIQLDSGAVEPIASESVQAWRLPALRKGGRSRRVRQWSAVQFVNRSEETVELVWVNLRRKRETYGFLQPGEERWMRTNERHVWLALDEEGEELAYFVAENRPGVALIDGSEPAESIPEPERPNAAERRLAGNPSTRGRFQSFQRDLNVWIRDATDGTEHQVTTDGNAEMPYRTGMHWSPDGRFLLAPQHERAEDRIVHFVESSPEEQRQPLLHSFDYQKPGDEIDRLHLKLFAVSEVGSTRAIPISDELFPNPWRIDEIKWEADSSRFTFLYDQRGHQVARWIAVDAASGEATTLIEEAPETFVDYSQKRYFQRLEDTNEILWMSERSGWNHLYLIDARTGGVVRPVTEGEWVVRSVEEVDEEARTVRVRIMGYHPDQDPYHVHYARVSLDDGTLTLLTEGDGTHTLELSPDGGHYVDTWSRVDLPPISELRRTADASLVAVLETADASEVQHLGWRAPERFAAKGRDGETDIWGIVFRPTNFDPRKRYPVIESIYAGPHGAHVPKSFRSNRKQQELAELGFVVVQIDGMGTNWRSKAFHDMAWQNIGDAGFADRIAWIRALAETDPSLDLTRVGIYGGSAGGQNAMRALIAHNDFYSVAVADCGCHDNRMDKIWWNEAWMGYPVGPHYSESSNVDQAHRMEGQLLLIVGEMDRNVDPASTMQVVKALIDADKDFDLLVVPGGGHGVAETRYGTRRRRDFFVRHLLGVEPRWE